MQDGDSEGSFVFSGQKQSTNRKIIRLVRCRAKRKASPAQLEVLRKARINRGSQPAIRAQAGRAYLGAIFVVFALSLTSTAAIRQAEVFLNPYHNTDTPVTNSNNSSYTDTIDGINASFWVRHHDKSRNLYVLEPVLMPKVLVRPAEGVGIKLLERVGGIIECKEKFHIVRYQDGKNDIGKMHLLECNGEMFEIRHFMLEPTQK